ncbi:MAG: hypothetical protein NVSMB57_15490 [Actinomycetota bacterium]
MAHRGVLSSKIGRVASMLMIVMVLCVPAHAATTRNVTASNFIFTPAVQQAVAGDTIGWTNTQGFHTVTEYGGASFDRTLNQGDTFSLMFAGGTVLYRCTFHSSLDEQTLVCQGMCGVVTDRNPNLVPAAPSITSPANGANLSTAKVHLAGTSEPTTTVGIVEGSTEIAQQVADRSGNWAIDVVFGSGTHAIKAQAVDVYGHAGPFSTPVSFTLNVDTQPPVTTIEGMNPQVFVAAAPVVRGFASDDVALDHVEVAFTPAGSAPFSIRVNAGGARTLQWSVTTGIPAGVSNVAARSVDRAGNVGDWTSTYTFVNAYGALPVH